MVSSYLKGINDLIGGGFKEKEVYSLYGFPSVGKSLYMIEEMFNLLANKYRVIWIDTEGGFDGLFNSFKAKFEAKYGVTDYSNFTYRRCLMVEDLAKFLGMDINVKYGDKITADIVGFTKKDEDNIYEVIGRKRGKFAIIVDSFTSPLKLQFGTSVQNFGARSDASSYIILGLMKVMEQTGAFSILSNHSSKNPTNPYVQVGSLRGGNTIKYYSKYIIDFEVEKKKVLSDVRKIIAVRTSIAKDWELFRWIKVTDNRYIDITETDLEEMLKGS